MLFQHQQFHFASHPGGTHTHAHTHPQKKSCPTHCFKTACNALALASGLSSFLVRLIHSIWLRAWSSDSGKSFWSRPFPHHPGSSESSSLSWPLKCSSPARMSCVVAKTVALPDPLWLGLAIVVVSRPSASASVWWIISAFSRETLPLLLQNSAVGTREKMPKGERPSCSLPTPHHSAQDLHWAATCSSPHLGPFHSTTSTHQALDRTPALRHR